MTDAPRRAALIFIFITVVIDVLAFGLIIPVLPKLIEQFRGGDTAYAAETYGLFATAWALMQFLFSPLLGALSDRWGRRPVILISCFGLGLDYIVMALAPTVGWLLVGRILSGITASSFSVSAAYVADITPPDRRAAGFGMLGAAFGLGFVVGPALGGLLGGIDPRLPFWAAAGLALVSALYGLLVLPESLPPERRSAFSWKRANPVGALTLLRAYPGLAGLAFVSLLFQLARYVLPSVFVLYTGYRYGWSAETTGLTLTFTGLLNIAVEGGLVRRYVKRFGERISMYSGLSCGTVGFLWMALAPTAPWFWAGMPIFALMGLFNPGLQSLMTQRVAPTEQGRLQGANTSIVGIAGMVAPALFTGSFAFFIGRGSALHLPGAPFLLAASLTFAALIVVWRQTRDPVPQPVVP
ncbi:MAG: TCR/Tet family MFS transporter [Nevskia sp.]|uniref:TCR/Tet family MFS transporter n=1 Tax=Nevskia sp. TaxID=1929292 RepID=UPI0040365513